MAVPRILTKPPIREAIVDMRIISPLSVTKETLDPLIGELRDSFGKVEEQRQLLAEFRVENGKVIPPSSRAAFGGVRLTSADGLRLVQLRTDGFSFNNVTTYMGGDAFIAEALKLWPRYAAVAQATGVKRLALRYINKLMLPLKQGDEFTRFLAAPAELPEPAPQMVSAFLTRTVAHDPLGPTAVVTQKFEREDGEPVVTIDSDVFFQDREFGIDAEELRLNLHVLRDVKNRCFFSLLTEEAVKLFV